MAESRKIIKKKISSEFTKDNLCNFYSIHKQYVKSLKSIETESNIKIRYPNFPEHISENIIKYAIQKEGDDTVIWNCKSGDLLSRVRGKLECKCFTSDGPISFTPSSDWDEIYFLDARNWLQDRFIVYRVILKYSSDEWKSISVSKTQTFRDQCKQGRRPRITWESLYPQISMHVQSIFNGTLNELV